VRLPPPQRYPFGPLERLLRVRIGPLVHEGRDQVASPINAVADVLGVDQAQVHRWRRNGLMDHVADRCAVKAGFHPYEVWPEMQQHRAHECAVVEADLDEYERIVARRRRQLERNRRVAGRAAVGTMRP
jgi:hypothetical protein